MIICQQLALIDLNHRTGDHDFLLNAGLQTLKRGDACALQQRFIIIERMAGEEKANGVKLMRQPVNG